MSVLIELDSIPEFLKKSKQYKRFQDDSSDSIEIPTKFLTENDTVDSMSDFKKMMDIILYWELDVEDISRSFRRYYAYNSKAILKEYLSIFETENRNSDNIPLYEIFAYLTSLKIIKCRQFITSGIILDIMNSFDDKIYPKLLSKKEYPNNFASHGLSRKGIIIRDPHLEKYYKPYNFLKELHQSFLFGIRFYFKSFLCEHHSKILKELNDEEFNSSTFPAHIIIGIEFDFLKICEIDFIHKHFSINKYLSFIYAIKNGTSASLGLMKVSNNELTFFNNPTDLTILFKIKITKYNRHEVIDNFNGILKYIQDCMKDDIEKNINKKEENENREINNNEDEESEWEDESDDDDNV